MFALALAALYAVRLHKFDIGADREHTLQLVCQSLLHGKHTAEIVAEEVAAHLHLNLQSIEVVLAVDNKHILRFELRHSEDNALHLRREHVDASDDKHVVAAAHNTAHLHACTSTRTRIVIESTEVLSAIAKHRHTFLRECCEHEFALRAIRQLLQRLRVDNLRI